MNAKFMLYWIAFLFCITTTSGFSQTLLKDINSDTTSTFSSSDEVEFVYMGGYIYFVADDGVHGKELWKTQGTAATTIMVKNINTLAKTGGGTYGSDPHCLVVFKNTLYFFATDWIGEALWKSNGTDAGTIKTAEIDPNQERSRNSAKHRVEYNRGSREEGWIGLLNVNNTNLCLGYRHVDGSQSIWWSDGTTNGTEYIATFVDISDITCIKNMVYFGATDARGWNLWRIDGKIIQIVSSITADNLTPIGDILFFSGHTGDDDVELWRTNGTYDTTYRVENINITGASNPENLTVIGNTLYFTANDGTGKKIWRSNGTADNTVVVENNITNPTELEGMGTNLYFATATGLYKTDGTSQGTILLKDNIAPTDLTAVGTTLYFVGNVDTTYGRELWKTTGTPATTVWVGKEIFVGNNTEPSKAPYHLTNCNGVLYCTGYDGTTMTRAGKIGREVWKSQGAATTTLMVADINVHSTHAFSDELEPYQFAAVGTTAYFIAAEDGTNYDLWKTTGTTAGTIKITTTHPAICGFVTTSTTLFIILQNGANCELWKLNETLPAKMEQLKDANDQPLYIAMADKPVAIAVGTNFYFQRTNDGKLWVTGGTKTTTFQVTDAANTPIVGLESGRVVNGVFYFSDLPVDDPEHLYKISGGVNKAVEIKDTDGNSVPDAHKIFSYKSIPYFLKWGDIWRLDATGKAIKFYDNTNDIVDLGLRGSYLYFSVNNGGFYEVWQTDGVLANTRRVQDPNGKFFTSPWEEIMEWPGSTITIYYFVDGTEPAHTLWQTDGTIANTRPLKDATGRVFSGLIDGVEVGAKFYFMYDDGIHGAELWESSGTPATTIICKEITPFGNTTFIRAVSLLGKLFVVADDGIRGRELWVK